MRTGLKPLLWSGAALLLMLMAAVPGLNVLAIFLLIVPLAVMYTLMPPLAFAIHAAVIMAVSALLIGPGVLFIGIFFIVPAVVIGHLYKRQAAARTVMTALVLVLLGQFLLELLVFSFVLDIQLLSEMGTIIRDNVENLSRQGALPAEWSDDTTNRLIDATIQSLPLTLIIVSFMMAVMTQWLTRKALRTADVEVPAFPRARDWMLPRSFVFIYLVVVIMDLLIAAGDESYMSIVVVNLLPLLRFAFTIQAIGFFFFLAHHKRWNRIVPLLIAIPVILFPPFSLIGVIDTAFPLRKSFVKS